MAEVLTSEISHIHLGTLPSGSFLTHLEYDQTEPCALRGKGHNYRWVSGDGESEK